MAELPIRFINHPMIDVGVATLCAAAGVDDPSQLTAEAIERFTKEVVETYLNRAMSSFLTMVVFANARFANPAQLKPEFDEKRRTILTEAMSLWKHDAPASQYEEAATQDERCAFSGDRAKVRVSRIYIPMTTDEKNLNFVPEGVPRLPIAGWCLLAMMLMPMGGLASKGRLWIVHSPDPKATIYFAKRNLERNRADFQNESLSKRPNYRFARTYLLRDLSEAYGYKLNFTRYPLTAYHFTSNGQSSDVEIIHLSSPALRFIREANRVAPDAWRRVVRRADRLNTEIEDKEGAIAYNDRNHFYEDLFDLPQNAPVFLRRYLMRNPIKGKPTGDAKNDPRYGYSFVEEADLISWPLTSLFLKEIMQMDKDRIETIKVMADRLAHYIHTQDQRVLKAIFTARNDYQFRMVLVQTLNKADATLFTLDEFVLAFFTDTDRDTLRFDWMLARDLMIIRILEKLYESGQSSIAKTLEEPDPDTETAQ